MIEVAGVRVVAPIDTVVDIARLRHPLAGVAACDAYLRDVDPRGAQALLDVNAARTRARGRVIKYRGEFGDPVEAIRAEKKRERQLRELASMARWGWAEVAEPQKLMRTLSAAGVVRRSAPRDALLAGVRTVLGRRR
ncbi:hypothetical protein [Microbacterium gilvum]|uniref:Uncharacterized protein n=1 Tax=Microbacterium gilvum TaxID=1336204 RepID=A0ABP8ZS02_9MICO